MENNSSLVKETVGYVPGSDFKEDNKESLIDIPMNDDTELWLIQLPDDKIPDFDGQKVSLELDGEGDLGTIEEKSGKVYNVVNYPAETADITVFVSSPTGPKVAGKISRHVSLVRYPDPKELLAIEADKNNRTNSKTSMTSSMTASKSQRTPFSQSKSRATHSSGKRSSRSELTDVSGRSRRSDAEPSRLSNHSIQDSGRGRSDVTISGLSEQSHRKKKKSKTDSEA